MQTISFMPIVSVDYGDDGNITRVEFDWFDSVNYGDEAVDALKPDELQALTDRFDKFVKSRSWVFEGDAQHEFKGVGS